MEIDRDGGLDLGGLTVEQKGTIARLAHGCQCGRLEHRRPAEDVRAFNAAAARDDGVDDDRAFDVGSLAMNGYSGRMGAMRLPAVTPEERDRRFEGVLAAGAPTVTCGPAGALLMPGGRDASVLPRFKTGSAGPSTAGPVGRMRSRNRDVVWTAMGAEGAEVAADAACGSRWMSGGGGTGARGGARVAGRMYAWQTSG